MSDRPFPYLLVGCKPRARRRGPRPLPAGYQAIRRELTEFGLRRCMTCERLLDVECFYVKNTPRGREVFTQCKSCHIDGVAAARARRRGRT